MIKIERIALIIAKNYRSIDSGDLAEWAYMTDDEIMKDEWWDVFVEIAREINSDYMVS